MPHVAALYRYPVKGFTPESCPELTVLATGQIAGDRVLGLRFADCPAADDAWSTKREMLVLMNTPGLATLQTTFDAEAMTLQFATASGVLVRAGLDAEGRRAIGQALAELALSLPENPLRDHPERLPLRVIGDGRTPRFHDNEQGQVSLHGRASIAALAGALDDPELSELRFRSNIAVEGLPAWDELDWVGKAVRIGDITFDVVKEKVRCLATHANPATGERDHAVMTTLTEVFGHAQPKMGVSLVPRSAGRIKLGDPVEL